MNDAEIIIHTDGGARGNPGPAACAFIAEAEGKILQQESIYLGKSTNNDAEYRGVILAVRWLADKSEISKPRSQITFYLDSELVVKQLNGKYKIRNKNLKVLNNEIKGVIMKNNFNILFKHIPRSENKTADYFVNKELDENTRK